MPPRIEANIFFASINAFYCQKITTFLFKTLKACFLCKPNVALNCFEDAFHFAIYSSKGRSMSLVLLNPDISIFENTVDPNQLASDKAS